MNFLFTLLLIGLFNASPDWHYNYDEAQQLALKENKTVLLVFSGSDWCKPCIQLHQELFEKEVFIKYANDHLILLKADFPYKKKNQLNPEQVKHNEALAEKYNKNGEFPLAIFIDKSGKPLGSFGFDKMKSPEDYIKSFKAFLP